MNEYGRPRVQVLIRACVSDFVGLFAVVFLIKREKNDALRHRVIMVSLERPFSTRKLLLGWI